MNLADLKKTKAGQRADNQAALEGHNPKPKVSAWQSAMEDNFQKNESLTNKDFACVVKPLTPETVINSVAPPAIKLVSERGREVIYRIFVEPMGAVRFTRAQLFSKNLPKTKRAAIDRYMAFKKEVQNQVVYQNNSELPQVPDAVECEFYIPMPASWSKKEKLAMDGKPHRQRPDKDNLEKAVLDAIFTEDGAIWKGAQEKYWTSGPGQILLNMMYHGTP